jgi:flavodoxin
MKALVVYDTTHGNTAQVAQAIGEALGGKVLLPGQLSPADLKQYNLLIVGSPTHSGWFTEGIRDLLEASPALTGLHVAAFDTRTATIWNRILPFGYAAPRIAQRLEAKGGALLAPPEGFVVLGTKGPLQEGELLRAADWARGIASAAKSSPLTTVEETSSV